MEMQATTQPTIQAIATVDEILYQSQLNNSILLFFLSLVVAVGVCYILYKALTFYDIF